jgi:hypothetical protein
MEKKLGLFERTKSEPPTAAGTRWEKWYFT